MRRIPRSSILDEIFLQNHVRIYLQHGGNLFTESLSASPLLRALLPYCRQGVANWISECLFHSSESSTLDEFPAFEICFLGAVAQGNPEFRTRLKAYLASYRSPFLATGTIYADNLLESIFGKASVLSRFHRLDELESTEFLVALCRTGTPSMLRPFIDTGIKLNYSGFENMLGNAASVGNLDIVYMLIESGANGALALDAFLNFPSKELSDGPFKHLLELLVEKSKPTSFAIPSQDALLSVLKSSRALLTHPEAPEILIRRKVFSVELMEGFCGEVFDCNYMCVAIRKRLGSVVELLLQHEAYANTMSTWSMFSIEYGAASYTEALIQRGADVNFLIGAGKSALQLARSNVTAPHPRIIPHFSNHNYIGPRGAVTAEEDAEILAVVERASHLKAQSTNNMKVHEPSCEVELQFLDQQGEAVLASQNMLEKAFGSLLTYYRRPLIGRHSGYHYYGIRDLWSLSSYEALLMRFFYVLSYVLLLALETIAFIRGHKRVRMPSRSILSAVALLLLAFVWGSSLQTMFPWKPDTGRSVTMQDS